jgi:RNA polymerase sigma-70 factor (ECF subfamily)
VNSQGRPSDAELIEACCAGRAEAFGLLVERYQDRLYNAVYHVVGNEEDARDVVQDAFLKAYENLGQFRGASSFYTWMFRIGVNLALTHRRRGHRLRLVKQMDERDMVQLAGTQAARLGDPPEAAMEAAERDRMVNGALHSLDADYRAALVLRDVEGLDYVTISSLLDVPAGTVKSRIHRARMMLREQLREALM